MTFGSRISNALRGMHIRIESPASNLSLNQAVRCMSSSKLFVGGLPYSVDDKELKASFAQYGQVVEARVIMDRENNRSKGFGFVSYTSSEEASSAINAMDGQHTKIKSAHHTSPTTASPASVALLRPPPLFSGRRRSPVAAAELFQDLQGRRLKVTHATDKPSRGGGGGSYGGNYEAGGGYVNGNYGGGGSYVGNYRSSGDYGSGS